MKKSLFYGAAIAMLGLAVSPLSAQTQTTGATSTSTGYVQTSKIIGTKVKTQQGEEIGVVKDVVLDRSNGCMAYSVISAGGTGTRMTGQAKLVAVPWSVYSVSPDMSYLTVTVERDRIYNAPVFEYSRIGDVSFTNSVYSAFGVSAGVGVSSATTTGATTQTAAEASPTVATSPGVNASPTAAATASATAMPSVTASPAESASPREERGTTRPETTPGKAKATATASSSRRRIETPSQKAERPESEGAESTPTEGKKTSRKHTHEGTTEPSSTPEER